MKIKIKNESLDELLIKATKNSDVLLKYKYGIVGYVNNEKITSVAEEAIYKFLSEYINKSDGYVKDILLNEIIDEAKNKFKK